MNPAGAENGVGVISTAYLKDPTDTQWVNDEDYKRWDAWMAKYNPDADRKSAFNVYGYSVAQSIVAVLKQCGDGLTRASVMKQAANLKDLQVDMLLPGVKINTGPKDFYPIEQMQLMKFDGKTWELFGPVIDGAVGS